MKWLALAVVLTLLPLFLQLPAWILAACLALIAFSFLDYRRKWLLQFLAIASASGIFLQYGTLFSREAGMALLSLLVCLKLVESGKRRNASLVVLLCYFLIMTWFFDSQEIWVACAMLLMTIFLTANLVLVNAAGSPSFNVCMKTAFRLLLQAAPFSLLLFLLFPRIPGPIWALPKSAGHATSGLSDTLSPGSISDLALSDAVAFRVEFGSKFPERSRLYWRGPVLWDYDGKTWFSGKPLPGASYRTFGRLVRYTVTLEPSGMRWLFALDMPLSHPPGSSFTPDRQIIAATPVKTRMRYEMTSSLDYETGTDEPAQNLSEALRIPQDIDPQARALARSWRGEPAADIARHAIDFFRSHRFIYTLKPPLLKSDEVDDFLFRTRSGFCEHYASSFAFLMRAAGVPARIVTGYQGGEFNPIDHDLTVRQSDAHAWVEIWKKGRGWIRIDPTAIVAPTRVTSGIADALPRNEALPVMMRPDSAWLRNLRFGWDAAANAWNQGVVGFGEDKQKRLFGSFGMHGATSRAIAAVFAGAMVVSFSAITAFLLLRLKRTERERVQEIYLHFCRKMGKYGIERMNSEGPLAYAERIASINPEMVSRIDPVVRLYIALRYGEGETLAEMSRFARLVKAL